MRLARVMILVAACLPKLTAQPALQPNEHRTVVEPFPGEELLQPCVYRLAASTLKRPVKAAWIIFERGQDSVKWFQDEEVRRFSAEHNVVLVLAIHCRSKEREDMIVEPSKGVGRALFTALDQFAEAEGVPELKTVPVIALGWSGAGSLAARLAGYRPDRYLAGVDYVPGQYEPLGVDTIRLQPDAIRAPQLVIANGADIVNGTERPYDYFRRYFDEGAPWTFTVQNRSPHCCIQNAQSLILAWLGGVLNTAPSAWGSGAFGYITAQASTIRDEWYAPVFNAVSARLGSTRLPGVKSELPAGWMPPGGFAGEWLKFERSHEPPALWFDTPGGLTITITGKPTWQWFVSAKPTDGPSIRLLDNKYVAGVIHTPNGAGSYAKGAYDLLGPKGHFSFDVRAVKAGETLEIYAVGFDLANPLISVGATPTKIHASITIGGVSAKVQLSELMDAGVYQINAVIPITGSGDQPLRATVGGVVVPGNIYVTVQ
jgi:hypothetical protein